MRIPSPRILLSPFGVAFYPVLPLQGTMEAVPQVMDLLPTTSKAMASGLAVCVQSIHLNSPVPPFRRCWPHSMFPDSRRKSKGSVPVNTRAQVTCAQPCNAVICPKLGGTIMWSGRVQRPHGRSTCTTNLLFASRWAYIETDQFVDGRGIARGVVCNSSTVRLT